MKKIIFLCVVGDLVESENLLGKLLRQVRRVARMRSELVICVNGGHRLSEVLERKGHLLRSGPAGMFLESEEGYREARSVLMENQVKLIQALDECKINASVIIPISILGPIATLLNLGQVIEHVYGTCHRIIVFTGQGDHWILIQRYSDWEKIKIVELQ